MGFGFNLLFIFVLIPISIILLILWIVTKNKIFGKIIGMGIVGLLVFAILSFILNKVFAKKVLVKADYYGEYVVNRAYFKGKQADWQYNHFRFEIKENDSAYFYVTNGKTILNTYKGTIRTAKPYQSEVLVMMMKKPTHHILSVDPTVYRDSWNFYLVFNSPKFGNVFFKKGHWQLID